MKQLGIHVEFSGEGVDEIGVVTSIDAEALHEACVGVESNNSSSTPLAWGKVVVRVDPRYFRPTEVASLVGDASKAEAALGWRPRHTLDQLVAEMVREDLGQARRYGVLRAGGFDVREPRE